MILSETSYLAQESEDCVSMLFHECKATLLAKIPFCQREHEALSTQDEIIWIDGTVTVSF